MELFRGTAPKVKFYLPASNASINNVTWALDGVEKGILMHSTPVDGASEVQLPYLQYDGLVTVDWTFVLSNETYTERSYFEVVTPILTKREVLAIYETTLTDDEYYTAEAAVRHIINAHCGQTFGKSIATWTVKGDSSFSLQLPIRLLEVLNVDGSPATDYYILGDGFNLRHRPYGQTSIKADIGVQQGAGIIYDPYSVHASRYHDQKTYSIYGIWGYNVVPQSVKEAAKLLINDYACADSSYRDRYLTSMTAADWRIQFNSGAFINTGNVRANQLLEPYVLRRGWAVL